jgi:predicted lipoprotein with Yx(FWY)xxD motif
MNAIRITIAAVALCALAACTGESGTPPAADTSTSLSTTPSEATPSESQATTTTTVALSTAQVAGVGTVLVEQNGRTVYLFTNDTGSKSTCTGTCASTWTPLTSDGRATTTGQANGTIGTAKGSDGEQQVTYDGHPLYLYSGDNGPGQANGQGIGGVWFAVTADGQPAKPTTTAATIGEPPEPVT